MNYLLFNTATQRVLRRAETPYTVDGQPGTLPPEIVELQTQEAPAPELTPGQSLRRIETPDVSTGTMQIGWEIIEPSPEQLRVLSLEKIKAETAAIYAALPVEARTAFAPTYVAAKEFIALDQIDVARSLIAAQAVPPELEPVKAAILARLV